MKPKQIMRPVEEGVKLRGRIEAVSSEAGG